MSLNLWAQINYVLESTGEKMARGKAEKLYTLFSLLRDSQDLLTAC